MSIPSRSLAKMSEPCSITRSRHHPRVALNLFVVVVVVVVVVAVVVVVVVNIFIV